MGLHTMVWTPTWTFDRIDAFFEERHYREEGTVDFAENFLVFGETEYEDRQEFCGTYLRNYVSREFWTFSRWDPFPRHPLLQGFTSFDWYGGGCSNTDICYANAVDDYNLYHLNEPDVHSMRFYKVAVEMYATWKADGGSIQDIMNRNIPEVDRNDHSAYEEWQRRVWDEPAGVVQKFWQERNPKCPINPTW